MENISSKAKMLDVKPLIAHYMNQLSLSQLFEKYIPKTPQMDVAPADALSLLVFNIINSPHPLYKISEWGTDYLDGIGEKSLEAKKYNGDCLGRCLDRLYNCNRNELMTEMAANAIKAHQLEINQFHNDSTTVTFKGRLDPISSRADLTPFPGPYPSQWRLFCYRSSPKSIFAEALFKAA